MGVQDYNRRSNKDNVFERPKSMVRAKHVDEETRRKRIDWITYYRRNVHRFVQHYMQVQLYPYQIIWIYLMGVFDAMVAIASRAVGKSWLIAVFAVARAILYPNSKIVIVSSTKEQAGSIISEKVTELRDNHPNIAREIRNITTNANKYEAEFHNGSRMVVVASRDSSRGKRSTFTIYEEFRLIDKDILDAVIRPFAFVRQPPYLKNPRYEHLLEEPKEAFISSAYHKGLWWYKTTLETIRAMVDGKNVGFLATDYLTAIKHNIKTKTQIEREKRDMDEITFLEEYENIPWGESKDAYFKLSMFTGAQKIKKAFYPQRDDNYVPNKNPYDLKRMDGEVRIVSVDIATRAGSKNDNTIISCVSLLPTKRGYERRLVYMESHNGENTLIQTRRIKQIFSDFNGDYIVLDLAQNGISIYDQLGKVTEDEVRGVTHDAYTIMVHHSLDNIYEELTERTLANNAIPIIYPISATAQLNNDIAVSMRDKLTKRLFSFLVNETDAENYLAKTNKDYFKTTEDFSEKAWLLHPYAQTKLFVNESVGLSMKLSAGKIKLEEQEGARKDRYTSVSYANYFASILDRDLLRETQEETEESWMGVSGFW